MTPLERLDALGARRAAEGIYIDQHICDAVIDLIRQARTLILAAPLHMPTWPETEARNSWVQDSQKWLDAVS
jgi:hypothetical protein